MTTINLDNILDSVFNKSVNDLFGVNYHTTTPSANIVDTGDAYAVHLFTPGMNKEDFNIKVDKLTLTVSSNLEQKETPEGLKVIRKEFDYSNFTRTFTLSNDVDFEKITATYDEGILTLMIPKKEEAKEKGPQFINID